jgi:RNA polymerase sigma-70 factor, ECF subfamily
VGSPISGAFFALALKSPGAIRLTPTAANGQPAFAIYVRARGEPRWAARALQVLALEIARFPR